MLKKKFRVKKMKPSKSVEKMDLVQNLDITTHQQKSKQICSIFDSPFRILKVAAKGNVKEVEKLVNKDRTRLAVQDTKGLGAIHHASLNGHVNVVDFIVKNGGDINLVTRKGDTALHLAVENGHTKVIDLLVNNGADTTIQNDVGMAPIHVAADMGILKSLEALLDHKCVDVNLPGDNGWTPFHFCAAQDRHICSKTLIKNGADPKIRCQQGFYPIHLAATSASAKTLAVIIEHVETLGCTRDEILAFTDIYKNTPLHFAVNGGDLEAVRFCLQAGAAVEAQQEDKSTPLHFASAQGSLEMVSLMYDIQPDGFTAAAMSTDVLNMTPLHRAALFNHASVVEYLLEKGADIDAQDDLDRTALLVAASKGCWKTVSLLIERGADVSLHDKHNRSFLHSIIMLGGKPNEFFHLIKNDVNLLLNEKDDYGYTPLHYASKEGHLTAIVDLINMGACINPRNNEKQSSLHLAARFGRLNTCRCLLESPQGTNIINKTDRDGRSALHLASFYGHTKIIDMLMEKGAFVTKDFEENTPLHLAASNGYNISIKLLLGVHANLLDCVNMYNETALHVAAREGQVRTVELLMFLGASMRIKNVEEMTFFDCAIELKNSDVARAIIRHERWREAMSLDSPKYKFPINGLIENLPEICLGVLDQCTEEIGLDASKEDYCVEYDFQYLQSPIEDQRQMRKNGQFISPLFALNHMVEHERVDCLSHPVCKKYLEMKWQSYGMKCHIINLTTYLIYLISLTCLVVTMDNGLRTKMTKHSQVHTNSSDDIYVTNEKKISTKITTVQFICIVVVMAMAAITVIKELCLLYQNKMSYLFDWSHAIKWTLTVTSALYVFPMLAQGVHTWQTEAGAIAVFLAWFLCLLFMQRFDVFGIYVVMFLEIFRTLVQALCIFSLLIVAFGLAFFLLMQTEVTRTFSTPGLSILSAGMMMLEVDFLASFSEPYTDSDPMTLAFGDLTIFFLVLFILLMPILLMNLLIGLAVGDIEAVQKGATLKRLAMQVDLHTDLELRLPKWILLRVETMKYKTYPNRSGRGITAFFQRILSSKETREKQDVKMEGCEFFVLEIMKQSQRLKVINERLQTQQELMRLIGDKIGVEIENSDRETCIHSSTTSEKKNEAKNRNLQRMKDVAKTNAIVKHWQKETYKREPKE